MVRMTLAAMLICQVPAADAKRTQVRLPSRRALTSQAGMDETFYLTNIAPQVGDGFNRHCVPLLPRPV